MRKIKHLAVVVAVIVTFGVTEFALSGELTQQERVDRVVTGKMLGQ